MTTLFSTSLTEEHDLSQFDCGKGVLNHWLRNSAVRADKGGTCRTYVWVEGEDPAVQAYYSVTPTFIESSKDGVSREVSGGMRILPGYLLAKFALDKSRHGQGLGTELLVDAIAKMMGAAQAVGGRVIVVDAIDDDAFSFYEKHDFIPVDVTPGRLVMKMATALEQYGIG